MRKLLLAALLGASPAWSAFSVGTPEFELRTTDCTTSCPMGTFTISGNGTLVILAFIRGAADSTPANGFACTVGGVSAPYVTGSSSDTGNTSQTRNYEILPANLPGAGSQAVECGTPSGSITSVHLTMFQVTGLTGETAEAVAGANGTSADTTADSLNTVTDGALVLYNIGYAADPGTVTAGGGQTELLNKSAEFDTRWAHAGYETGATPAGATAGGTTHNSATTYRSRVAYAIAPPEVLIASGAVVECFCPGMFDVPAQTLPDGQESAVYSATQLTVFNGVEPRTWGISMGALPDGLSLSSTGIISGTPDAAMAGSYNFTVEVTDADGGLAYRTLNIVVAVASGGALAFYEDAEDGDLTSTPVWTATGGCVVTSTAALEGADEVTKSAATDCTPLDGLNLPQVFIGFDTVNAAPATRQWQTVLGLGTAGAELFQVIRNANGGIHAKTAGQTGQEVGGVPRGFYLGTPLPLEDPESNAYVELHYIAGTGANATFRARINNGGIQEFSAGTATENFAKLVFRDANDNVSEDFIYDRIEVKDDDWPGRVPLPVDSADTTPPTVLSTVPATSATGVTLDSDIAVNFSEAMDPATITTSAFTLANGGAVAGAVSFNGTTATFNPTSSLSGTAVYTATITTDAEDVAGNALAGSHVWTFTTGATTDTTAPTVGSVVPVDNATGVSINTALTANFSEPMDPASITTASFTLMRGATPVTGAVNYSGTSASFTPTASLATNSAHTATITTTAQDLAGNNLAGNFTWDFTTGGAPVTPPWIANFIPQRTHYVTVSGSGSANGTIGNPESYSTARGHYLCGDLHIYRAGNYVEAEQGIYNRECTSGAPAVFKGYVDPATGQPENALWQFGVSQPGRWNWFVGLHCNTLVSNPPGESACFQLRKAGGRVINTISHDVDGVPIASFRNPGASDPGIVMYGNITYRAGPGTNGAHNYYVHNDYNAQGYKYFVQNISVESQGNDGRRIFQVNDTHGDRGMSGVWLEKNFFGDANPVTNPSSNEGQSMVWDSSGAPTWVVAHHTVMRGNFFVDFFQSPAIRNSVRTNNVSMQAEITGNYFARANLALDGYLGNQGTHDPFIFTGNEIYDPPLGIHLPLFRTRREASGSAGADGSFKIRDADVWDNNVYGGTFVAQLHCNGSNLGNRTLAQWRTGTDACRVTPASAVGFDINSSNPANPTTNKVVVTVNEYQCPVGCPFTDQARGNIYLVNWEGVTSDLVDISSVVRPGKQYVVRYPRDFFGTPAASGICPASGPCNVSLPTKRTSSSSAGRFANAYVITGQP